MARAKPLREPPVAGLAPAEWPEPRRELVVGKAPERKTRRRSGALQPLLEEARLESLVRMQLAGIPNRISGQVFGVSADRVSTIVADAARTGDLVKVVDKIKRDLSRDILPLIQDRYREILTLDPESLTKNAKGHQLQLTAARDLAKGLGVFTTKTEVKSTSLTAGLDDYLRMRETRQQGLAAWDAAEAPIEVEAVPTRAPEEP